MFRILLTSYGKVIRVVKSVGTWGECAIRVNIVDVVDQSQLRRAVEPDTTHKGRCHLIMWMKW